MKFKVTNILDEDYEVAPGITFEMLLDAAIDGNGDFVLNPPNAPEVIELPEYNWDTLYATLFNITDADRTYEGDEWQIEFDLQDKFAKRYRCV